MMRKHKAWFTRTVFLMPLRHKNPATGLLLRTIICSWVLCMASVNCLSTNDVWFTDSSGDALVARMLRSQNGDGEDIWCYSGEGDNRYNCGSLANVENPSCCICEKGKYIKNDREFVSWKSCQSCGYGMSTVMSDNTIYFVKEHVSHSDGSSFDLAWDEGYSGWRTFIYADTPGHRAKVCGLCTAGSYKNGEVCVMCPVGKFQSLKGAGYCSLCPLGTYASTGQSVCTNCPVGKTTLSEGRYSVSECLPCTAGSVPVNAVCSLCGAGQEAASGQGTCSDCPGGKYATANDVACLPCEAGKYSAGGAAQCDECPKGKISTPGQATAAADCNDCAAGTFSDTDPVDPAARACIRCDAGHHSYQGSELCGAPCPPGTGAVGDLLGCQDCPAGKYAKLAAESALHTLCVDCAAGKYSTAVRATDESTCLLCTTTDIFQLNGIVQFSPPGSDANTDCMSCNTMIGEYVDFDAQICRLCSWPFGLYTAAENGRVVCGPCPLGELPQMTNCVEPVDGVLETQVLQACNTRYCRQTPGFLQVWHFTISQASDVVYHRLDYTLPALFQRASHPVDLGRNQPPGLAPGTVFEDEGAGSLLDTSVHHIDLVACQPGFHCTDYTYVWVLNYTLQRFVGDAREAVGDVEYRVVFSPEHDPDTPGASQAASVNNALLYSSWPFPSPGQNFGQRCAPGFTTLEPQATANDCVPLRIHMHAINYFPVESELARSRVLAEDHFPYISAVYNAWTTAPRDVFGTVAATFTCDPGFGPDGSARLSLSAACVACASYDPPQFNDGGGFCEPCAQDCATTVVQTWQARLNARRTPDRMATVAWSSEPGAVPVADLTKLDTCGGASGGTCMCPQGFFLHFEVPLSYSVTPFAFPLSCTACPPGQYQPAIGVPNGEEVFTIITTGTCAQHRLQAIRSIRTCEKAFTILDIDKISDVAILLEIERFPFGCTGNGFIFFVPEMEADGTVECSDKLICVCEQPVCLQCGAGQESVQDSRGGRIGCRDCPVDTYNPVSGQMCEPCQWYDGVTNAKFESGNESAVGATDCVPCPEAHFIDYDRKMCEPCAAGTYRSWDSNFVLFCAMCEDCPGSNEYRSACDPATGEITCSPCNCTIYEYCDLDETTQGFVCKPCTGFCSAGKEYYGCSRSTPGACRACDAGKYKDKFWTDRCTDCEVCLETEILPCGGDSAGLCASCGVGEFMDVATKSCQTCPVCPIGEHDPCCSWSGEQWFCDSDGQGPHAACTDCHALGRPQPSAAGCQACPEGFYNAEQGTGCLPCENLWPGRVDSVCLPTQQHVCDRPFDDVWHSDVRQVTACRWCQSFEVLDVCANECREVQPDQKMGRDINCNRENQDLLECACIEQDHDWLYTSTTVQCGAHALNRTTVTGCLDLRFNTTTYGWEYQQLWRDSLLWSRKYCKDLALDSESDRQDYCDNSIYEDWKKTFTAKQACCICGGGELGQKYTFPISDCRCEDGYFWNADEAACAPCGQHTFFANEYTADGALLYHQAFEECTPCPTGSGHFFTAQTSVGACVCAAGYEPATTEGKVSLAPSPACVLCPPGTSKSQASSVRHHEHNGSLVADWPASDFCAACPPGTFTAHFGQVQCLECPVGYFCGHNTSEPTKCPGEMISPAGSSLEQDCACTAPGTFVELVDNATQVCKACSACPANFFDPCCSWNATRNDWHCAPGSDDVVCREVCRYRLFQTVCIPCAPGFFKPDAGIATCEPCPVCAEDDEVCRGTLRGACLDCAPGTYARPNATQCETCPACRAGTYDPCCSWDVSGDWFCAMHPSDADCVDLCQEQVFELACKNCPAGTYKNTSGSSACTPCSTCPAMQVREPPCGGSEAGECIDCDPGKFSQVGENTCQMCDDCGPGTYDPCCSRDTAADTWHCLAHPSSPACLDTCQGRVLPTGCVACPPGKYKTTSGSANCVACPVCEAMLVLVPPCGGSEQGACVACWPGSYSEPGDAACQTCPACPVGKYDPCCSWDAAVDNWNCAAHPTGQYCSDTCPSTAFATDCVACPPGKYKDTSGSANCAPCPTCPDMQTPSTSCTAEAAGTCVDCPTGKYSHAGDAQCSVCTACAAGTYDPCCSWNLLTKDWTCPDPSHPACSRCAATAPSPTCIACLTGTYKTTASSGGCLACDDCPAMTSMKTPCSSQQNRVCKDCPPGTFSVLNSPDCQYCPFTCEAGSHDPTCAYDAVLGDWFCHLFPTDTSCLGFVVPTPNACEACPLGTYKDSAIPQRDACRSCTERRATGEYDGVRCGDLHRLEGCGSDSAGTCETCPPGHFFDACDNSCTPMPVQHRRVEVACDVSASHVRCTACGLQGRPVKTHVTVECGPRSLPWSANISEEECNCESGFAFQLHTTTSRTVSLRSTGSCVACKENEYYDACAQGATEKCKPLPPGTRRVEVDCAVEAEHASCTCGSGVQTQGYVECGAFGIAVPAGASGAECHCAPGYARVGGVSNQTCAACGPGTYGQDSVCVACPDHEGHAGYAAVDVTSCVCDPGFVPRLRTCAGVRVYADREDVRCLSCEPGKFKAGRSGVQHRRLAGTRVDEAEWAATEVCEVCLEGSFA